MDQAKKVREGEALNWSQLESYLKKEIPTLTGEISVSQFHGGHANLTYLVKIGTKELVVRRPPFGRIAPGAHDMKREYKVLSKLYKHFSPAPQAYHYCDDDAVIGAPFVVIERRTGVVVRTKVLDCFKKVDKVEEKLTSAMISALSELHLVDINVADLNNLGRPDGFTARQLEGWSKRWHQAKSSDNENMDYILEHLKAEIPKPQKVSIIHNDIKLDNCQFQPDNPALVTSIFDWDMCTLGDPLIDLGTTLSYYPDERKRQYKELPIQLQGDFPPKAFLLEKYQDHTGLSLERINWYEAFACWKAAVVSQQLFRRYELGDTKDKRMASFGKTREAMATIARGILENKN